MHTPLTAWTLGPGTKRAIVRCRNDWVARSLIATKYYEMGSHSFIVEPLEADSEFTCGSLDGFRPNIQLPASGAAARLFRNRQPVPAARTGRGAHEPLNGSTEQQQGAQGDMSQLAWQDVSHEPTPFVLVQSLTAWATPQMARRLPHLRIKELPPPGQRMPCPTVISD